MGIHLVMGGSGYFGSILAEDLVKQGYRVRIFDKNTPSQIVFFDEIIFFQSKSVK